MRKPNDSNTHFRPDIQRHLPVWHRVRADFRASGQIRSRRCASERGLYESGHLEYERGLLRVASST